MIFSESFLSSKALLVGTGAFGLMVAAVEAAPPEIVAKAAPTPWEAIIMASVAASTVILRHYTAPEKKLDDHNKIIQDRLNVLIEDGKRDRSDDLRWKLETSHVLGAITTRQEDYGKRLQRVEDMAVELRSKT